MKKISILVVLAGLTLSSCRTIRFGDVLPETKGTEMGSVSIGRENIDFFVIPEPEDQVLPFEFNTMAADDVITSASSIVVFKTRERHPVYRSMHTLGAPVRAFDNLTAAAYHKAVDLAHSLVNRPNESREEPEIQTPLLPPAAPEESLPAPVQVEAPIAPADPRIVQDIFAKPVATAAESTETQINRNRG